MSQQPNRWLVAGIATALLVVFVGLRLWRLHESLFFFGDLGRDFLVLQQWIETGKPPLLGPQTSALPFNQSAWYFYLLLPGYLLFKSDLANTVYSSLVIHSVVFSALIWVLWRRRSSLFWPVWLAAALLAIHPQMVLQQRTVWNPSFVALSLLVGVVLSLVWRELKQTSAHTLRSWFAYEQWLPLADAWILRASSLCLALAIGFSYSAAPAVLVWLILLSLKQKQWWRWWLNFGISLGLVFAPMALFELRHDFPLTKMMLFQEKLAQHGTDLATKLSALSRFVVAGGQNFGTWVMVASVAGLVGLVIWLWCCQQESGQKRWQAWQLVAVWWAVVALSYIILPVQVQAHYVFPLLIASILTAVLLPSRWKYLVLGVWAVAWLQPSWWRQYSALPLRSIETSWSCARAVCATVKEPLFVSVQAGAYPYHNGIEFQYLLRESGCQVKSLDTQNDQAQVMTVFVEDSVYQHGQTAYNELTQFGASNEEQIIHCSPKLQVHVLRRK